ncbi:hypothetical protein DF027_09255 [Burkholderia cenocepacia]|nr:hypothetical protein DF028_23775 [Burkholderia cenocepacia]RQV48568.1 hypothetical protein DF027_09255 [Burkholderia cenocepacia]RQV80782.1 hypothetical protein DF010_09780 [Burkholderia cenocepacia]
MCSVRFRCRAIAGEAGNDAASLGFGGQTKHPRGWQSPFPAAQHCGRRWAVATGFLSNAPAARHLPASVRWPVRTGSPASGFSPLYKRVAPPNLF